MAVKAKDVAGDAAAGAALGSAVPGIGTAAGAVAGGAYGLLSGLFDDSDEQAAQAQQAKIAALQRAGNQIQAYRPVLMGMEREGLNQQLGQYQGAADILAAMNGQGAGPNMAKRPGDPGQISPMSLSQPTRSAAYQQPTTMPVGPAPSGTPRPISPMMLRRG